MNVLRIVAAESARARWRARIAMVAAPAVVGVAALTLGALLLAGGRWLALPAVVPFLVWTVALGGAAVIAWRARRWQRESAPQAIAVAIEREQGVRRGALTGLLELAADEGAFVRRAGEALGEQLAEVAPRPAPAHRARLARRATFAALACANRPLVRRMGGARCCSRLPPVAARCFRPWRSHPRPNA
jgi:hypothetical protein